MHLCVITNIESIHVKKILKYVVLQGHRVDVIGFDKAIIEGVNIHQIKIPSLFKSRRSKYLYCAFKTRKLVKKIRPDILLSIYLIGPGALGAVCNYHPYVIIALGSDVLIAMRKYFFKRLLAKFAIKRADYFISVSEAIADKLIEYGIPKDHILINPIGVDTTLFSPLDFSSKKQKIQIVSTRRLEPVLNVKQLINSLPFLFANRKDFCVVIIGTGSEYERIKKSIKNYRLEENVRLLGRVSFPILLDTLKKSQIFISMSHSDGAPVSLFEAMACGCFPIVSDTPANKAWIQDGINGFLVPLGDYKKLGNRIIEAADNPILLNKARLINRQIVEDRLEFSKLMDNLIINLEKIIIKGKK